MTKQERRQAYLELLGKETLPPEYEELLELEDGPVPGMAQAEQGEAITPRQIVQTLNQELVVRKVGELLAKARGESGLTMAQLGEAVGISKGRVNQLEKTENIELATLVRIASALGYTVQLSLQPKETGKATISTQLEDIKVA